MPDLFDACVTVAPSVHLRSVGEIIAYLKDVPVWREVYQALKPGAYAIVFTDPRTFDLVSLGIRAAGFENRDTIAAQIPGPSWRPVLMFRKPLEGTVADNVLKHGTGALNIDGCRVRHASPDDFAKHKLMVDRIKEKGGSMADSWKNSSDLAGASDVKEGGRWPPNVVMSHADGCKRVGPKKVKPSAEGKDTGKTAFGLLNDDGWEPKGSPDERPWIGEDGLETVEAWECIEGCPIKALDEQTGERPSTLTGRADPNAQHDNPGDNHGASWFGGGNSQVYADSGGASRFFPQFEADAWECVDGCPVKALDEQSGECRSAGDYPSASTNDSDQSALGKGLGKQGVIYADSGGASRFFPQFEAPPLGVVEWFIRLVTPEGGKVLDPFNTGILDA